MAEKHKFKLDTTKVISTPLTGVSGFKDSPCHVVNERNPFVEFTDEQLDEFKASGVDHLFDFVRPGQAEPDAKKPTRGTKKVKELQARYKELSGVDADPFWDNKVLFEKVTELELNDDTIVDDDPIAEDGAE